LSGHRPCRVHESEGPVGGEVSQNWVWRREPPGELKQQRLAWAVVLWQESSGEGQEEKVSL
jgi:hypothetical protein